MIPVLGPNGQPLIGREGAQQAHIQQMYFGVYFSLIPVLTGEELRKLDEWNSDELNTDRIVDTAKKIAIAAMKKIGITMQD